MGASIPISKKSCAGLDHAVPVGAWKYCSFYEPMTTCFFLSLSHIDDRSFVDINSHRYPAEALTRTQALRGMTCDAAYAAFAEDMRGRLVPGFAADFVVLDRDIMQVPSEDILGTKVLATVVDGQVAYGGFSSIISLPVAVLDVTFEQG